jgi:hypothetical protein
MNNDKKIFAFKLAEKKESQTEKAAPAKWKAREGVSVAGCTDAAGNGNYRYSKSVGTDNGVYC